MTTLFDDVCDVPQPKLRGQRLEAVRFTVAGEAVPQGSKVSHLLPKKGGGYVEKKGRPLVVTREDSIDLKDWRLSVAAVARQAYSGPLLSGALSVSMVFYRTRPQSHFSTSLKNAGKIRPSAPEWPTTKPDLLKCGRAIEDALTGIIYCDDAQIVDEHLSKRFGTQAHVDVVVTSLDGLVREEEPPPTEVPF